MLFAFLFCSYLKVHYATDWCSLDGFLGDCTCLVKILCVYVKCKLDSRFSLIFEADAFLRRLLQQINNKFLI